MIINQKELRDKLNEILNELEWLRDESYSCYVKDSIFRGIEISICSNDELIGYVGDSLGQIASVNISSYGFGVRCVYVKKGSPIIDMLKAMIIAEKERAELLTTASESSLIVLEPRKASRL